MATAPLSLRPPIFSSNCARRDRRHDRDLDGVPALPQETPQRAPERIASLEGSRSSALPSGSMAGAVGFPSAVAYSIHLCRSAIAATREARLITGAIAIYSRCCSLRCMKTFQWKEKEKKKEQTMSDHPQRPRHRQTTLRPFILTIPREVLEGARQARLLSQSSSTTAPSSAVSSSLFGAKSSSSSSEAPPKKKRRKSPSDDDAERAAGSDGKKKRRPKTLQSTSYSTEVEAVLSSLSSCVDASESGGRGKGKRIDFLRKALDEVRIAAAERCDAVTETEILERALRISSREVKQRRAQLLQMKQKEGDALEESGRRDKQRAQDEQHRTEVRFVSQCLSDLEALLQKGAASAGETASDAEPAVYTNAPFLVDRVALFTSHLEYLRSLQQKH